MEKYLNDQVLRKLQLSTPIIYTRDTIVSVATDSIPEINQYRNFKFKVDDLLNYNANYMQTFFIDSPDKTYNFYSFHLVIKMYVEIICHNLAVISPFELSNRGLNVIFSDEFSSWHTRMYEYLKNFLVSKGYSTYPLNIYQGLNINSHHTITNEKGEFIFCPHLSFPNYGYSIENFYVLNQAQQPILFSRINVDDLKPDLWVMARYINSADIFRGQIKTANS